MAKMTDKELDRLFEKMDRKTASKVANQGSPKEKKKTRKVKKTK